MACLNWWCALVVLDICYCWFWGYLVCFSCWMG